jgi:histidinol-phosphate aminotransferase
MSPTPVTFSSPTAPAQYTWEATDEAVAERYGVPLEQVIRFDLNTSPAPPPLIERLLATGQFDHPLSEYPPSDYRRLTAAAAARYGVSPDEVIVGAGADEILDVVAKAFLPPGSAAVIPAPTYSMYRVLTEQRGARVLAVPRRPRTEGWSLDRAAVRRAAGSANVVWLCSPNNPTALPEPDGLVEALLDDLASDAAAAGRPAPVVVLDEAYAEFAGRSLTPLRESYPRLVVVRTASKAYALAGLRVGFAIATPAMIAELAPYRPPCSVSIVSISLVTAVLLDPEVLADNLARVVRERARLAAGLRDAGWDVAPSVTNFLLADFGSPERADATAEGLLHHGLVPRTFGSGHPLAGCLRVTVRDPDENDRLIEAAQALATAPASGQEAPR